MKEMSQQMAKGKTDPAMTAFAGLNKGGPDFGLNFGVVRWF
ncbi:MAG TPA: hypothetical protein VFK23_00245 [Nitrospirota bacterium]|nr:hypothetical protein [Nitrospirota bacterium]